jgi:hypothetical protein
MSDTLLDPPRAQAVTPPSPATPTAGSAPSGAGRWPEVVDAVGLLAMGVVALSALGPAFGGTRHLLVGTAGLLIGLLVAWIAAVRRLPVIALVVVGAVLYLVLGGPIAVPDLTTAVVVPSAASLQALAEGLYRGVPNILTTIVPLGDSSQLLVVPWGLGLACGMVAMSVARRCRRWYPLAVLAPLTVLVVALVLGTASPAWRAQGAVFAVFALLWAALRQQFARAGEVGSVGARRLPAALAMLGIAALVGTLLSTTALVAGGRGRTVVRNTTTPPIDLRSEPSPLSGFRDFRSGEAAEQTMFTLDGVEAGDRIRLATLDSYDGVVWHVSEGVGEDSSGFFRRVGSALPASDGGQPRSVSIEIGDYDDIWLPTVGEATKVSFAGGSRAALERDLRYNLATDTAVVSSGLRAGDRYRLDVVVADPDPPAEGRPAAAAASQEIVVVDAVAREAGALAQAAGAPPAGTLERLQRVAQLLDGTTPGTDGRRGYRSDGDDPPSLAGHSAQRMTTMVAPDRDIIGNEEQFASLMALIAASEGFPARVVMGFQVDPQSDGSATVVTGADVTAWTEVAVEGVGWVVLDAMPEGPEKPEVDQEVTVPRQRPLVPPPTTTSTTLPERSAGAGGTECPPNCPPGGGGLPAWVATVARLVLPPALLIGGFTALMAGLKRARRNRRRSGGEPSERVAAGWVEVCDLARDLGDVVPGSATRRETAVLLGRPGVPDLARRADSLVFGPTSVDDSVSAAYWDEVELTRRAMLSPLGRFERWKALVNPSSLRRARTRRTRRPAGAGGVAPIRSLQNMMGRT